MAAILLFIGGVIMAIYGYRESKREEKEL